MKYITYILINGSENGTYVGHTNNRQKRLRQHNGGRSTFTSRFKNWKILLHEEFTTEQEAIKREKYFKSAAGRRWMKKNLFKN